LAGVSVLGGARAAFPWISRGRDPGKEIWLLIEWPEKTAEPTRYFFCDLPADYSLRRLVQVAKARWKIEQDYQQLKEELGLDHYEGRSWSGWHHHVTLVMLAHSFLTLETLRNKKNFWVDPAEDRVVKFSGCCVPGQDRAATVVPWSGHRSHSSVLNEVILTVIARKRSSFPAEHRIDFPSPSIRISRLSAGRFVEAPLMAPKHPSQHLGGQ